MSHHKISIVLGAILTLLPLCAQAKLTAQLTFLTDYFYRGFSKSNGDPTVRGNIDYEHSSGFYLGLWGSRVDLRDQDDDEDEAEEEAHHADIELYPYLGWSTALGKQWRVDINAARYIYDGPIHGRPGDYNEFSLAFSYRNYLTGRFYYAPSAFSLSQPSFTYELQGNYPLTDQFELSAGVGYYNAARVLDYSYIYWNLGVTWFMNKYLSGDLRYVGGSNSAHAEDEAANGSHFEPLSIGNKVIFSLSIGY